MTPMMLQYLDVKKEYPDTLLFYRLGDFYEMFFEDAITVSRELELVLTGRDCGEKERAPMCGVPYHSADGYIARLLEKGYKVAVCEQTQTPEESKGLLEREVKRVITPGTVIEGTLLDEGSNNYLACLYCGDRQVGLCFVDISTGEMQVTQLPKGKNTDGIFSELTRYNPSEMVINQKGLEREGLKSRIKTNYHGLVEVLPDELFDPVICAEGVAQHFGREHVEELGVPVDSAAVSAMGVCLYYLHQTQKKSLDNIREFHFYTEAQYMRLDSSALRNLELTQTLRSGQRKGSLVWVLDRTRTAMGKRMLKQWMEHPLLHLPEILKRQNAVQELVTRLDFRQEVIDLLSGIADLERLVTRITYETANPKEMVTLANAVTCLPRVKELLGSGGARMFAQLNDRLDALQDIREEILQTLAEDPPLSVREGGMIRRGFHPELDELFSVMEGGKGFLSEIERREQEKTGIKKLKIGYNRVFGYYIEVSNSYREMVPPDYIRKQTLVNCERFITQELKELEGKVLGAKEKSVRLEYDLFCKLRQSVALEVIRVQRTAQAVATLDVLASLATVAAERDYCRPEMTLESVIQIQDGRHPVVEQLLRDSVFVPNNTLLDSGENRIAIITGPNMAGKSTYMRQVALIALMAQMGGFVPAVSAKLGVIDGIYTRVGAADDLSSGQSTFMVEMSEMAFILNNATANSLLVLDEIGRGTSTFDGMSIARAVLEYVADPKKVGAKTLFSTHYHELTALEGQVAGVKNYNIAVKRRGDDITFLRRIVRGGADDSYGILVAKLAGVPNPVIQNAKKILAQLEEGRALPPSGQAVIETEDPMGQQDLTEIGMRQLVSSLQQLDAETLTPLEAMNLLFQMIQQAKSL